MLVNGGCFWKKFQRGASRLANLRARLTRCPTWWPAVPLGGALCNHPRPLT